MDQNKDTVISAFSDEQTARLVGLSVAQLRNWDRTGFFTPALASENRRQAYSRVYTFADLLSLQVLKKLRKDMGCSLQHLREVKEKLQALPDAGWSNTTLYVLNRRVVFHDQEKDEFYEPVSNQTVLKIPLEIVRSDMKSAVRRLWARDENEIGRQSRVRRVVQNQTVIAGTRVTVQSILDFYEAGYTVKQILAEFPTLNRVDVELVIEEAA